MLREPFLIQEVKNEIEVGKHIITESKKWRILEIQVSIN
jgi:hypothetical protein